MNRTAVRTAAVAFLAASLAACGAVHGGSPISPPPVTDTEGRIMSVTGDGFALCGISRTADDRYRVEVCGDQEKARAAIEQRFPGVAEVHPYRPGEGGAHTPQQLAAQYWVNRTADEGFTVTSTRITADGTIAVGVDGDLDRARAVLEQRFPHWTAVHAETASPAL
ncbi:hypothetical protein [Kitasatospora sp. NPDC004531]